MSAPMKPWESTQLNNSANIIRTNPNPAIPQMGTTRPALPPRPMQNSSYGVGGGYGNSYGSSYSPYSSYGGYGGMSSYGGLGGLGGYSSMGYRSSMYGGGGYGGGYGSGYGSYGGMGGYGGYGSMGGVGMNGFGGRDNAEERFVQYVEERSRTTFSNIENVVRAFSSISMMLDNTFFAITSSFRAVLGVAENMGRLRSVFGQIWYSISIFRLFNWFYRKMRGLMGLPVTENLKSAAWSEAANGAIAEGGSASTGSSWPTVAFLGAILAAPYLISKLLPKYEDKADPEKWKGNGIRAKAAFDFVATAPNELSITTNDEVLLAPKHIQEEMRLWNTGWAYGTSNGRSGVVPLNYIVTVKNINRQLPAPSTSAIPQQIPELTQQLFQKPQKKVSFGENQIYEAEPQIIKPIIDQLDPKAFETNLEIKPEVPVENITVSENDVIVSGTHNGEVDALRR